MALSIVAAGLTDQGMRRKNNEDALLVRDDLFVVADGMGGHAGGEVASSLAVEAVRKDMSDGASFGESDLLGAVRFANQRILVRAQDDAALHGMATTIVAATWVPALDRLRIAHVGDSRAYRIRGGVIRQITRDHSLIAEYERDFPFMSPEERARIPTHVVTRALGLGMDVNVDMTVEEPRDGDIYLLCSDGLTGMLTDQQILMLARTNDVSVAARRLIDHANAAGGDDNVTVVVFRFTEDGGPKRLGNPQPWPDEVPTKNVSKAEGFPWFPIVVGAGLGLVAGVILGRRRD